MCSCWDRRIAHGCSSKSAELFDPSTGNFTATGNMTAARGATAAALLPSGMVLIAEGVYGANAELFDPSTGKLAATGGMTGTMRSPTAMLLPNGTVLVAGGNCGADSDCPMVHLELYDPAAGIFSVGGLIEEAAYTATLLPSGMVLVAGGYYDTSYGRVSYASTSLYDPTAGSFTAAPNMTVARYNHTATLLPDGTVLIAGGGGDSGPVMSSASLASAELYK